MTDNQMPEAHRGVANFMTMMAVLSGFSALLCCIPCVVTAIKRSIDRDEPSTYVAPSGDYRPSPSRTAPFRDATVGQWSDASRSDQRAWCREAERIVGYDTYLCMSCLGRVSREPGARSQDLADTVALCKVSDGR